MIKHHGLPGTLIAFEGIDGCGKSTVIRLLFDHLSRKGIKVTVSATPGGTPYGSAVRKILFDYSSGMSTHHLNGDVCSLLYLTSHIQNWHELVQPALRDGHVVLADRWDLFSGQAYAQAGAATVSDEIIKLRSTLAGPLPDLVVFMSGNPGEFLFRASKRDDNHQSGKRWSNVTKLSEVQDQYLKIIESYSSPVLRIKSDVVTQDEVLKLVLGQLELMDISIPR